MSSGCTERQPDWTVKVQPGVRTDVQKASHDQIVEDEPTLPAGQRLAVEGAMDGFKVVNTRTVTRSGEEPRILRLTSVYRPSRNVVLVGTGGRPARPSQVLQNRPTSGGTQAAPATSANPAACAEADGFGADSRRQALIESADAVGADSGSQAHDESADTGREAVDSAGCPGRSGREPGDQSALPRHRAQAGRTLTARSILCGCWLVNPQSGTELAPASGRSNSTSSASSRSTDGAMSSKMRNSP